MELAVDVAQAFIGYVGVDLGRGNILVAKKFLNHPQINTLGKQISGHGMTQGMRRGKQRNTARNSIILNHPFYRFRR